MITKFLRQRLASFGFALAGGQALIATQPNARIHLAATVAVVLLGGWLGITSNQWALILLAIALVWMAEAMNTGLEFLADELTLEQRPRIKFAKDIAAFGVLITAIAAVFVGFLVFGPLLVGRFFPT